MPTNISNALTLPPMFMVRQNFEVPPQLDIEAAVDAEPRQGHLEPGLSDFLVLHLGPLRGRVIHAPDKL